jgi:hypothetical protein
MENKYQQGKIYKIVSANSSKCYVGSTTKTLKQRLNKHYNHYNENKTCSSREVLSCGDVSIELIKEFPCNSKRELEREEGKYQLELDCVNKHIAGRTHNEYINDNRERVNYMKRLNYIKHKDKICLNRRQRVICEFCKKELSRGALKRHIKRKHSSLGKVGKTTF